MNPELMAAAAAVAFLAMAVGVVLWLGIRREDANLEHRVRRVAAVLGGSGPAAEAGDAQVRVFLRRPARSWLYDRIQSRFSMLEVRSAFPKAVGLGFLVAVAAASVAVVMQLGAFLPLLIPAAWAAGSASVLAIWDSRRRSEFVKRFPEVVDHVVRLTRAGLPAIQAISVISEEAQEPVAGVLKQVSNDLSSGLDPAVVLPEVAARVRIPEFTLFSAAVSLQRTTGGGISVALSHLSAMLRARLEVEMKAYSSTAQTRITLVVLSLVPLAVVAGQSIMNPESIEFLLDTESGATLLRWGVGLIVAGLLTARAIAARFRR